MRRAFLKSGALFKEYPFARHALLLAVVFVEEKVRALAAPWLTTSFGLSRLIYDRLWRGPGGQGSPSRVSAIPIFC